MIRILKSIKQFFIPTLETTSKRYRWTSTLSDPASMSDPCDSCQNIAKCCQNTVKFQRDDKNDGEL